MGLVVVWDKLENYMVGALYQGGGVHCIRGVGAITMVEPVVGVGDGLGVPPIGKLCGRRVDWGLHFQGGGVQ